MGRTRLQLSGKASFRYFNPDGTLGWVCHRSNAVTLQGVDWLLNVNFNGLAPSPASYVGLINDAGFVESLQSDTHASHPGWSEWTGISSPTRPAWIPQAANGGLMGTSSASIFNITANGTLRGCFLSTIDAVGSLAAGYLYNTVITLAGLSVSSGGVLYVTPSVRLGE